MATDVAGHTVPGGSDYAARKSLLDLSLTVPGTGIKSCASEAAANLYITNLKAALSTAGLPAISADNPVYVSRSDLGGVLMRHDGTTWRALTQQTVTIANSSTTTVDANGAFIIQFGVTFAAPPTVVCMDGGQGSGAATIGGTSTPATTTQIRLIARKTDGTPVGNGGAIRCNWIAIGILA